MAVRNESGTSVHAITASPNRIRFRSLNISLQLHARVPTTTTCRRVWVHLDGTRSATSTLTSRWTLTGSWGEGKLFRRLKALCAPETY